MWSDVQEEVYEYKFSEIKVVKAATQIHSIDSFESKQVHLR
jgi:hypothetical protein